MQGKHFSTQSQLACHCTAAPNQSTDKVKPTQTYTHRHTHARTHTHTHTQTRTHTHVSPEAGLGSRAAGRNAGPALTRLYSAGRARAEPPLQPSATTCLYSHKPAQDAAHAVAQLPLWPASTTSAPPYLLQLAQLSPPCAATQHYSFNENLQHDARIQARAGCLLACQRIRLHFRVTPVRLQVHSWRPSLFLIFE